MPRFTLEEVNHTLYMGESRKNLCNKKKKKKNLNFKMWHFPHDAI